MINARFPCGKQNMLASVIVIMVRSPEFKGWDAEVFMETRVEV